MQRLSQLFFTLILSSLVGIIALTLTPPTWKTSLHDEVNIISNQAIKLVSFSKDSPPLTSVKKLEWSVRLAVFETGIYRFKNNNQSPAGLGYIIRLNSDSTIFVERVYPATFGARRGMKEREGDYKTPHGLYRITKEKSKRVDSALYGGYFLELNYPNMDDRKKGRTGSAIGIHGGRVRPTRGCIRILDDGWEMGDDNIGEFTNLLGEKFSIAIVQKLSDSLKGEEGAELDKAAFTTYLELMKMQHPKREAVLKLLERPEPTQQYAFAN